MKGAIVREDLKGKSKEDLFARKFTKEMVFDVRARVEAERAIAQDITAAEMARRFHKDFSSMPFVSFKDYVSIISNATPKVMELHKEGKLSWIIFQEVAQGKAVEVQDVLAEEIIERKLSAEQVRQIKVLIGKSTPLATAIQRVTQKVIIEPPAPKGSRRKDERSFDDLLDEIGELAPLLRMKISMAIDIMPLTAVDNGAAHYEIFEKIYLLRHILKEQLEFVDNRVKRYLDEIAKAITEKNIQAFKDTE